MNPQSSARKAAGRGPRLRPARFEDHPQIAAIESSYGLVPKSFEEWKALWLANPVYRQLDHDWDIGWVVEDQNQRIIGSLANIPLLYTLGGRKILAASRRGLVVEPAYRSASLLLLDRLIHQDGIDLYLNNTVGPESAACFETFQCPRVPAGRWDRTAFWITGYRRVCESLPSVRRWPLARPLSYPLSAAALLADRLKQRALPRHNVKVMAYAGFDERFDLFWEELKANNPHLLLAARSRETLEWHFQQAIRENKLWIAAVEEGPRMAAYAICDRRDKRALGLKRVRLVDFQSLDASAALLAPLLSWALRKCRDEDIDLLESTGRWLDKGEFLDRFAPHQRKLPTWTYFYSVSDPELAAKLADRRVWAPSTFDGDASL